MGQGLIQLWLRLSNHLRLSQGALSSAWRRKRGGVEGAEKEAAEWARLQLTQKVKLRYVASFPQLYRHDTNKRRQSTTSTVDLSTLEIDPSDPRFTVFSNIFAHFQGGEGAEIPEQFTGPAKGEVYYSDEEDDDQEAKENAVKRAQEQEGLTRRQRRQAAVSFAIQCSHFLWDWLGPSA